MLFRTALSHAACQAGIFIACAIVFVSIGYIVFLATNTGRCVDLCYGPHKVRFAERWAEEHGVDLAHSAFYTDSVSDLPMLQRVGEARVINPDPRLRVLARRHGWRVETWR